MNESHDDDATRKDLRDFRWRGVLCSLFVPGLGHFALGHGRRALRWYALCLIATFTGILGFAWSPLTMWAGIVFTVLAYCACVVDVSRLDPRPNLPGLAWLLVLAFMASIPVDLVEPSLRAGMGETVRIAATNMSPTLLVDDHVMVRKHGPVTRLGQVVVYQSPLDSEVSEVGRIVALPGDDIEWDGRVLLRNGAALEQTASAEPCDDDCIFAMESLGPARYLTRIPAGEAISPFPKLTVPEDHVFVLSDDRTDERDSRIFGAIPTNAVVGVASFVYYTFDDSGIRWERINRRIS